MKEYKLTDREWDDIVSINKRQLPVMRIGNGYTPSLQDNINDFWMKLGKEHGFDWTTVEPIKGDKTQRTFKAKELTNETTVLSGEGSPETQVHP